MKVYLLLVLSCCFCAPISFGESKIFVPKAKRPISGELYVIVDKSDYELNLYDDEGWIEGYACVFGTKNQGDKMFEGDKKTPNGTFSIIQKRDHKEWTKIMLLDYPTQIDKDLFEQRKKKGLIPKNAKIGGGIAIHGTQPGKDYTVNVFKNWTNGCVSVRKDDILELFDKLPLGTKVTIQP